MNYFGKKMPEGDLNPSKATAAVRSLQRQVSQEQGGTQLAAVDQEAMQKVPAQDVKDITDSERDTGGMGWGWPAPRNFGPEDNVSYDDEMDW